MTAFVFLSQQCAWSLSPPSLFQANPSDALSPIRISEMKEEPLNPRAVVRNDGWRPLATTVSFVNEILNSSIELRDEDYLRLLADEAFRVEAEKVFLGRPLIPERLNPYIYNQGLNIHQAIVELIANGQDATVGKKSIGRFGVGEFQSYQELKQPQDTIVVTTSTDGINALRLTFKIMDGILCFKAEEVTKGIEKGTKIEVHTNFSQEDIQNKLHYLRNKFKANTRGKILVNGEQINKVERFKYINGDKLVMPDIDPMEIEISETGYVVKDKGSGMGPKVLFEKFLIPKESSNALEGKPLEQPAEIREETKIFYSDILTQEGNGVISIQVSGVANVDIPIYGINIPKELILELPHDAWLPESRNKISLDQITQEGLIAVMRKLTDMQRADIEDRFALLNGMALLVQKLSEESQDQTLLREFRRLCRAPIAQAKADGKIILPNREAFKALKFPDGLRDKVMYLDEHLYEFFPGSIEGITREKDFHSPSHTLYLADLDVTEDRDLYLDGYYPNGQGWILFDRKTWQKHKHDPWLLDLLLNFGISYGDEGRALGKVKASTDSLENAAQSLIGTTSSKKRHQEVATIPDDAETEAKKLIEAMFTPAINALLVVLGSKDGEFIRSKIGDNIRSNIINKANLSEVSANVEEWLKSLMELKEMIMQSSPSVWHEGWIRDQIVFFSATVLEAHGRLSFRAYENKLYLWMTSSDDKEKNLYEVDAAGNVFIVAEHATPIFIKEKMYLVLEDKATEKYQVAVRTNGENKVLLQHANHVRATTDGQTIIAWVPDGNKVNVVSVEDERAFAFCAIDKKEADRFELAMVEPSFLVKRGNKILFSDFWRSWRMGSGDEMDEGILQVFYTSGKIVSISEKIRTVTSPDGLDLDSWSIRNVLVLPNGNIAIDGDFKVKNKSSDGNKVRVWEGLLFYDEEGRLLYNGMEESLRNKYKEQNYSAGFSARMWVHAGFVYFQEQGRLKRMDENGKVEVLPEVHYAEQGDVHVKFSGDKPKQRVQRVLDMQFFGDKVFLFTTDADIEDASGIIRPSAIVTLDLSTMSVEKSHWMGSLSHQDYCAAAGCFYFNNRDCIVITDKDGREVKVKSEDLGFGGQDAWKMFYGCYADSDALYLKNDKRGVGGSCDIVKLFPDGSHEIVYSMPKDRVVEVSQADRKRFPGSFAFVRWINPMDQVEHENAEMGGQSQGRLPPNAKVESVFFDPVTSKVTSIAGWSLNPYYDAVLRNSVFHIADKEVTTKGNMALFLQKRVVLQSNVEKLRQAMPLLDPLLAEMTPEETENLRLSLHNHEHWIPALIFLDRKEWGRHCLEGLNDVFNTIIGGSKNIKQLRKNFKFINFLTHQINDEKSAARAVERWARILLVNEDLADVVADKMQGDYKELVNAHWATNLLEVYQRYPEKCDELSGEERLYLNFLLQGELDPPSDAKPTSFEGVPVNGEIVSRDLASLIKLRTSFPQKIMQENVEWSDVVEALSEIKDNELKGVRRSIAGAVNGQDRTQHYWLRELAQNCRDIIRTTLGIGAQSGFLGHGFHTVSAVRCDEIRFRTGNGQEAYELILKPSYDPKGDLINIEILHMRKFESDYKGTQVQRINFFKSRSDIEANIGLMVVSRQAKRFLGAIPSRGEDGITILLNGEVLNEDGFRNKDLQRIVNITNSMPAEPNAQGYYEWVMSVEDPVGMNLSTILNKLLPPDRSGKPEQIAPDIATVGRKLDSGFSKEKIRRVTVDRLYVDEIQSKYIGLVPELVLDILKGRGWNIHFPAGTPVPRTRNEIIDAEKYAPWIATLALKTLVKLYMSEKEINIPNLPLDYIYANSNAMHVLDDVRDDANWINAGLVGHVDFRKYNNPHHLAQLLTLLVVDYEGEVTSLDKIKRRVLEEYKKKNASDVSLKGVLPAGMSAQTAMAEAFIRGHITARQLDISHLLGEPILVAFNKFGAALNRLVEVDKNTFHFECVFDSNHGASACGDTVIWNLASQIHGCLPAFLAFIEYGEGKRLNGFMETYAHETAHTVEYLYEHKHGNIWTHQRDQDIEGAFGWIMKKLLMRMAKNLHSTEDFRHEFLATLGIRVEELKSSYARVVAHVEQKQTQAPASGADILDQSLSNESVVDDAA